MIPSDWLEAFAVFAEDASLSAAARRLHLSQPAVHAQLKRLQELLGVALYRRAGRGLALTREGIELAAFARETRDAHTAFAAKLRGDEEGAQRIVIAAGASALVHVVSEGLRAFVRSWKGDLGVVTCDAAAAVDAVLRGEAHVGVAAIDAPVDAALLVHPIVEVDQTLVVRRDHPLAKRRTVRIEDLDGARFVVPPAGRPQRVAIEMAFAAAGITWSAAATAIGWDVTVRLVELGVGIGIVNASHPTPRAIVKKPLRELPRVRYVALTRTNARKDVNRLVGFLVEKAVMGSAASSRA